MDPFLQHFNNIFLLSPLANKFSDIIQILTQLNKILQTEYLTQFEFVDFNPVQPTFQKINFPGVKALSYDQLNLINQQFTNEKMLLKNNYDQLLRQTIYDLQYLYYIAKRIACNVEDVQTLPQLIAKAKIYRLKIDFQVLQCQSSTGIDLETTLYDLDSMLYGQKDTIIQITPNMFLTKLENFFKQKISSLIPIFNLNGFLENVNQLLIQSNQPLIQIVNQDDTIIGCEGELTFQQIVKFSQIVSKVLGKNDEFFGINSLYVLSELINNIYVTQQMPVDQFLTTLISQLYKNQLSSKSLNQMKYFAICQFLLTGQTFLFTEEEFYYNFSKSLSALNDLIMKIFIFPDDIDYYITQESQYNQPAKRKRGLFGNCGASKPIIIESENVVLNIKRLSVILNEIVSDNHLYDTQMDFYIQDEDLYQFLNSLGGLTKIYYALCKLFYQLQNIFIYNKFNSIFEGIYLLISMILKNQNNSLLTYINSSIIGAKIENISDMLQLVNASIEVAIVDQREVINNYQNETKDNNQQEQKPSLQNIEEKLEQSNQIEI